LISTSSLHLNKKKIKKLKKPNARTQSYHYIRTQQQALQCNVTETKHNSIQEFRTFL